MKINNNHGDITLVEIVPIGWLRASTRCAPDVHQMCLSTRCASDVHQMCISTRCAPDVHQMCLSTRCTSGSILLSLVSAHCLVRSCSSLIDKKRCIFTGWCVVGALSVGASCRQIGCVTLGASYTSCSLAN